MHKYLLILLFLPFGFLHAQKIVYQDILNGGVTGSAYNPWFSFQPGQIEIFVPSGCTIRKALLFVNSLYDPAGIRTFSFNDVLITFDQSIADDYGYLVIGSSGNSALYKTLIFDVSNFVSAEQSFYNINPPEPLIPYSDYGVFNGFYLYVVYESELFAPVCAVASINNIQPNSLMFYELTDLNQINSSENVSLAVHSSSFCDVIQDGSYVYVENNVIGLIGGLDNHSFINCAGVAGSFYYHNGTLFGLGNDVANNNMSGPDAIANIENYIVSNNSIDVLFEYQSNFAPLSNPVHQLFLTYTSPCQPFSHSLITSDTTTCPISPLQLGVTVPDTINAIYEWLPQTNLSCYDCPNPVFLGDSTINYTVRIWASDSCSKVLPVRVRVLPQPSFESIDETESVCGFSTGAIAGASTGLSLPHSYQINNSAPQNNFSFSNLSAGEYTLTVTDANGCSQDSTVQIIEINNVQAAFTVNPSFGAAPLQVQTQNNSQNATQYEWFWSNQSSMAFSPSILLDTAGAYTLTLVASNGAAHCNDTATALIFVEEPFVVFAYTFVTDEADIYQIFLSGVSEFDYKIYALDGKLVYQKSGNVEDTGYVDLWEISGVASGMYVFRVRVKDANWNEKVIEGKVVVMR